MLWIQWRHSERLSRLSPSPCARVQRRPSPSSASLLPPSHRRIFLPFYIGCRRLRWLPLDSLCSAAAVSNCQSRRELSSASYASHRCHCALDRFFSRCLYSIPSSCVLSPSWAAAAAAAAAIAHTNIAVTLSKLSSTLLQSASFVNEITVLCCSVDRSLWCTKQFATHITQVEAQFYNTHAAVLILQSSDQPLRLPLLVLGFQKLGSGKMFLVNCTSTMQGFDTSFAFSQPNETACPILNDSNVLQWWVSSFNWPLTFFLFHSKLLVAKFLAKANHENKKQAIDAKCLCFWRNSACGFKCFINYITFTASARMHLSIRCLKTTEDSIIVIELPGC